VGLPHAPNRGNPLKLEYTNKEEADAARIQIAKGENVNKVQSATLLYGIEQALKQAFKAGAICVEFVECYLPLADPLECRPPVGYYGGWICEGLRDERDPQTRGHSVLGRGRI
jgi:hypothetical protein